MTAYLALVAYLVGIYGAAGLVLVWWTRERIGDRR
jgi:hypothetical protein